NHGANNPSGAVASRSSLTGGVTMKLNVSNTLPGSPLRIGLVHDYLVHVRGGERVFQALCDMFPAADVYTLIHNPDVSSRLLNRPVRSSFLQRAPGRTRFFRAYLPFYPIAARRLDLSSYDLIISSSSAWAHWIRSAELA